MDASIVSATEAGRALPRLLNRLATNEGACYITDGDGRARAVLLDVDRYHAMMDALELPDASPDEAAAEALVRAMLGRSKKR